MTDTDFSDVTSTDVAPGETPAAARKRRQNAAAKARRAAAKPPAAKRVPKDRPPADIPPAAAAPRPTPPPAEPRGPGRPRNQARRAENATAMLGLIGTGVFAVNRVDGAAILNGAPGLAEALAELAETNKTVARVLDTTYEVGGWAKVALAAWGITGPILVNHGAFGMAPAPIEAPPASAPYTPPPARPAGPAGDPFGGVPTVTPDGGFVALRDDSAAATATGAGVLPAGTAVPPEYADRPHLMPFRAQG